MTDTWAAKVLEGVPRYDASTIMWSMDGNAVKPSTGRFATWIKYDDALAAIASMGAGDGLVERHADKERNVLLNTALSDLDKIINGHNPEVDTSINNLVWDRLDKLAVAIEAKAADRIAALTAQNREMALDVLASSGQAADAYAAQLAAEAEVAALTAQVAESRISEPHDPGDFVGDIFYGHPIKTTMGTHRWTGTDWVALPSEAEALAGLLAEARKEAAALRERVARLEGALTDMPKAVLRTTICQGPQWPDDRPGVWLAALEACAKSVQTAVDAALTDGGKDG